MKQKQELGELTEKGQQEKQLLFLNRLIDHKHDFIKIQIEGIKKLQEQRDNLLREMTHEKAESKMQ